MLVPLPFLSPPLAAFEADGGGGVGGVTAGVAAHTGYMNLQTKYWLCGEGPPLYVFLLCGPDQVKIELLFR